MLFFPLLYIFGIFFKKKIKKNDFFMYPDKVGIVELLSA